ARRPARRPRRRRVDVAARLRRRRDVAVRAGAVRLPARGHAAHAHGALSLALVPRRATRDGWTGAADAGVTGVTRIEFRRTALRRLFWAGFRRGRRGLLVDHQQTERPGCGAAW